MCESCGCLWLMVENEEKKKDEGEKKKTTASSVSIFIWMRWVSFCTSVTIPSPSLTKYKRCRKWTKWGKIWGCVHAYISSVCVCVGEGEISMKICSTSRKQQGICKSPSKTQEIAWLPMGYNVTGRQVEPTRRRVPREPVPGSPQD